MNVMQHSQPERYHLMRYMERTLNPRSRGVALLAAIVLLASAGAGCSGDKSATVDTGVSTHATEDKAGEAGKFDDPIDGGHVEGEAGGHDHGEEPSGEVRLTPEGMKDAGITVEPVMRQPMAATFSAPGRVVPTQNGIAHVGTVVPGRVTRLYVSEGARVGRGAALAEVEAFDIGQLKGELMSARADAEQRRAAVARQERLAGEGIGARRALEEAQSAYGQATAAVRAAEAKLRAAGIDPASVGSGSFSSRIVLRSPIAGVVARRAVVLGEYLEPNKDAFEVVDNATVWIDAQVPPASATGLAVGAPGFVRGHGGERRAGRIIFIAPTLDPESRTLTVRVEVANGGLGLRPETFVNVEFERAVTGYALVVPSAAIETDGARHFVYREHEPGTFQRVEVETGSEAGGRTVISAGVKEGERIAAAGVFYLRSARQKGELQEHEH